MENQRNLILAVVLCGLLIIGYDFAMNRFYPQPEEPVAAATADPVATAGGTTAEPAKHTRTGGLVDPAELAQEKADLKVALKSPDRVKIDSPRVSGSINLVGAQVDDLVLKDYRETVDKDSGPVRLFSPAGTPAQHFAEFGFIANGQRLPANAKWTADGEVLSPGQPVTLSYAGAGGITYTVKLSIDDQYMITAEQSATNAGTGAAVVQPYSLINRTSRTASLDQWIAHSGPMGVFGEAADYDTDYEDVAEAGKVTPEGKAAWTGFTDIYWLSALVPQKDVATSTDFRSLGNELFRADMIYDPVTLGTDQSETRTTQLFAGAKESVVLDQYEEAGIEKFGLSIDWGWFRWFEKPMLWLLRELFNLVGNFGVAIICLTIIIRGLMFPIAQKQFASMAQMKAVQPKMKAIQEKYKDDKQTQQQKIMELYKEEKVNPLAGCLPLLIQIPIFFALYKVLVLAIEMRHQPFYGWLKDLSAPDPAHIFNLFGLLPFDVPTMIAIGPLAVGLGITMWLTFKLNPSAMDPVQQQIFNIMPWVLMFIMAPFAAGLLLYWNTSNILTLAQQKYLYSKHPQLRAAAEAEKAEKAKAQG
ncbi:membrane protein insertase YidC [Parerythrobacter aestuarii]|uniref:membrane protein insertase YidC n=1 Tax=Parerythrobacter aestuarii TaxID=3020909 RepID=UPI0024DE0311|nr:membrane protein insertase YidC [Parerythrobacter aestuarii]